MPCTQFQNGVLARYPAAVTELAIFAIASSIFSLLHAGVNFLSQMSNVYARSRHGLIKTLQLVLLNIYAYRSRLLSQSRWKERLSH